MTMRRKTKTTYVHTLDTSDSLSQRGYDGVCEHVVVAVDFVHYSIHLYSVANRSHRAYCRCHRCHSNSIYHLGLRHHRYLLSFGQLMNPRFPVASNWLAGVAHLGSTYYYGHWHSHWRVIVWVLVMLCLDSRQLLLLRSSDSSVPVRSAHVFCADCSIDWHGVAASRVLWNWDFVISLRVHGIETLAYDSHWDHRRWPSYSYCDKSDGRPVRNRMARH